MTKQEAAFLLGNAESLENEEVTILQYLASTHSSSAVELAARTYELPSRVREALDHLSRLGFVEMDTSDVSVFRISQGGQAALSLRGMLK